MTLPPTHLSALRLGTGYALADLGADRPLRLAGIDIEDIPGAEGAEQDDGDCVARALVEALIHACGLPGLDSVFAEEHPERYFANGLLLVSRTAATLGRGRLGQVLQCSVQVFHARPALLRGRITAMRSQLAIALAVPLEQTSVAVHSLPGQAADPAPGEVAAFATLLCLLAQDAPVREPLPRALPAQPLQEARRSPAELRQIMRELESLDAPAQPHAGEPVPASDEAWRGTKGMIEEDEFLPERARQFERSVATKLAPLPPAPPPKPGDALIVYSDGASRGNPGEAATGWCILSEIGLLVHEGGSKLGTMTNNQAEYCAVLEAAQWIEKNLGLHHKVEFRMDSQLVQRQLTGEYRIKDGELKDLAMSVMRVLTALYEFKVVHVPRAENSRADALANLALDGG